MLKKIIIISLFLLIPLSAAAIDYQITIPIPGLTDTATTDIGSYIAVIFKFGLSIVGLVAFGMLVYNGVKYVLGAGIESLAGEAKTGITQVIIGVILLFASIVILDTINPCILQTVNFWRNRAGIQAQCQSSTLTPRPISSVEQREIDTAIENLISGTGPQVTRNSNNVEVIGYSNKDAKIIKVIVNPDGSYEVQEFNSNGTYTPTGERGDNFYDYTPDFAGPPNSTWQQTTDTQIRSMVLENSSRELSYRLAGGGESHELTYLITPTSNNNSFSISLEDTLLGRNVTADGTCERITPSGSSVSPYYRCADLNIGVDGQSQESNRVVYLEELPDEGTRNTSYEVLQGFLTQEMRDRIGR